MIIKFPYPPKELNPNYKCHWSIKAEYKAQQKHDAYYITKRALNAQEFTGTTFCMSLVFHPPDKRTRDLDNVEAACKSLFDGMCQALGIDDSQIKKNGGKEWGDVVKGGEVVVNILDQENK
jgi:crossover junction endodeoxyribonuclease RusA